jgi:parvulin-like peptidyl-prolyl isomerase
MTRSNRVFNMKKDDVSQPTKKGDKFYIFKVTDRRMPTFEQSREQLLSDARKQKGYSKAIELANEALQKFKESKNADAVVAEINKSTGSAVASSKETPFFAEGDTLPGLGSAPELESAIFELKETGEITEVINLTDGQAIAQYTEKRDPHDRLSKK